MFTYDIFHLVRSILLPFIEEVNTQRRERLCSISQSQYMANLAFEFEPYRSLSYSKLLLPLHQMIQVYANLDSNINLMYQLSIAQ